MRQFFLLAEWIVIIGGLVATATENLSSNKTITHLFNAYFAIITVGVSLYLLGFQLYIFSREGKKVVFPIKRHLSKINVGLVKGLLVFGVLFLISLEEGMGLIGFIYLVGLIFLFFATTFQSRYRLILTKNKLYYQNFFYSSWAWVDVEKIETETDKVKIINASKDLIIHFDTLLEDTTVIDRKPYEIEGILDDIFIEDKEEASIKDSLLSALEEYFARDTLSS